MFNGMLKANFLCICMHILKSSKIFLEKIIKTNIKEILQYHALVQHVHVLNV